MNTETENGMPLISDMFGQMMFLMPNAGVSAHPVKTLALQENEQDLTATEVPSFGRYFDLCGKKGKKISLNGLSMRTLRECYQATEDLTSLPFCLKWTNWGTIANGLLSTASITEYPRTGKECTLSDILEPKVSEKYFLSAEQIEKIVFQSTSSDTGTGIEETHKSSHRVGGVEALSTCQGGGREHHTAIPMFGIDYNKGGQERQIANTVTTRNTVNGLTNIKQDGTAVCVPIGCIDRQGRLGKEVNPKEETPTLRAQTHGNEPEVCIPVLTPDRAEKRQNGRRMKDNGDEAFTLTSQDIHGVALKIKEATSKGYAEAQEGDSINLSVPESKTRRGRVGKGVANTLDTSCEQGVPVIWYDKYSCYIAIRKLTPRECFRLQGWTDDYFEKAEFVNSDSQLYKQAGNGVTVNVVYEIGKVIRDNE